MKNKNGFTLLELIITVCVLAVILLIAVPLVQNAIGSSKESTYKMFETNLKDGARLYLAEFPNTLGWSLESDGNTESTCITLNQIKERGFFTGELVDPRDNVDISNGKVIKVIRDVNLKTEEYEIVEKSECSNYGLILTLNDANYGTIENPLNYNDTYHEKGATATLGGLDVSDRIEIIYNNLSDGQVLNVLGDTTYSVTYKIKVTSLYGEYTDEITRTISVADLTPPVLTYSFNIDGYDGEIYESGEWTNKDVYQTVSAYAVSGIKRIECASNINGPWTECEEKQINNETTEITKYIRAISNVDLISDVLTYTIRIDKVSPTINLIGGTPYSIIEGESYVEPGITPIDNYTNSSELMSTLVESDNIDESVIGSYQKSYTVTDKAGNSTTVIRTVEVLPPLIYQYRTRTGTTGTKKCNCETVDCSYTRKTCWGCGSTREDGCSGYKNCRTEYVSQTCNRCDTCSTTNWGSWSSWTTTPQTSGTLKQCEKRECRVDVNGNVIESTCTTSSC